MALSRGSRRFAGSILPRAPHPAEIRWAAPPTGTRRRFARDRWQCERPYQSGRASASADDVRFAAREFDQRVGNRALRTQAFHAWIAVRVPFCCAASRAPPVPWSSSEFFVMAPAGNDFLRPICRSWFTAERLAAELARRKDPSKVRGAPFVWSAISRSGSPSTRGNI
jgi:hypothetical protein